MTTPFGRDLERALQGMPAPTRVDMHPATADAIGIVVPPLRMWQVGQWHGEQEQVPPHGFPDERWWVVAPDRQIALEVILEHEESPADVYVFDELPADQMLSMTQGDADLAPYPPGASIVSTGDSTTITAPVGEWLRLFRLPGVLGCTAWGAP
jgi:hypothetical protein